MCGVRMTGIALQKCHPARPKTPLMMPRRTYGTQLAPRLLAKGQAVLAYIEFRVAPRSGLEGLFASSSLALGGCTGPSAEGGRGTQAGSGTEGGAGDDGGHGGRLRVRECIARWLTSESPVVRCRAAKLAPANGSCTERSTASLAGAS
jgi:hypothetical protein